MTDKTLHVAAIQMVSSTRCEENLATAERLIAQAAAEGAQFVLLPEYFCLISADPMAKVGIAEEPGSGPIQNMLSAAAKRHGIWLAGGSMPFKTHDPKRVTNTLLIYSPTGENVARYDKCNLFSIVSAAVNHDENISMIGGNQIVVAQLAWGKVGLAICYDARFPTFFEQMGPVDMILLPSAFTFPTGQAHWELLMRARAVDNQCFVLAAAQGGQHEAGRRTWGHSMAVSPWGKVLSCLPEGEGIVHAKLDLQQVEEVRGTLPVVRDRLKNRQLKGVQTS